MYDDTVIARFWARVDKSAGADACWLWTGARCTAGYGQMSVNGKLMRMHRLSLELERGEPLGKLLSCHHCDNPPCVNPTHLFAGTYSDNRKDSLVKRGKQAKPSPPRGPKPTAFKRGTVAVWTAERAPKRKYGQPVYARVEWSTMKTACVVLLLPSGREGALRFVSVTELTPIAA